MVGFQSPCQFDPWIPLLLEWLFWALPRAGQTVYTPYALKMFFVTRRIKSFKNKARKAVGLECLGFGGDNVYWQVMPSLCKPAQSGPTWQLDSAAFCQDIIAVPAGAILNWDWQLITAAFSTCCLPLPVLVLEQLEYARWGWLPLPAPAASASPATTASSASTTSPAEHGGSRAAQHWQQRGGRSVQHTCSYGSKQHGGDPDAGDAALSAHGGKARGFVLQGLQGLCPPGPLLTSKTARESPGLEMQN